MRAWPFQGDTPLVRARRVAVSYRAALLEFDPRAVDELDERFSEWGESWMMPRIIAHDPDEWLSPKDAANLACVSVDTLRQLRVRGRLTGRFKGNKWEYQVSELWKLSTAPRGRHRYVTDTLATSGTTVPEAPPGGS